jgi:broad specificity phosphatase PhoE
MQLLIIRHAQSVNNASMMFNERDRVYDPGLSDLGHLQAQAAARHLCEGYSPERITDGPYHKNPELRQQRGFKIDKLYCSPMYRTLQTASYIAKATGLTPHVRVDIHEHGGLYLEDAEKQITSYPGKTRAEILSEFPGYVLTDEIGDTGWWKGGMEDLTTAYARAIKVAQQLREEAKAAPDERIALVTHGTFIDALLKALFNQLPSRNLWYFQYNTAMTRVDFHHSGELLLRFMNRVDHLTADTIS